MERKAHQEQKENVSSQEGLQQWKEHFVNLPRNLPEDAEKTTEDIINGQLDLKLWQFTAEKLKKSKLKICMLQRNISWSMEYKEICQYTSSIMQFIEKKKTTWKNEYTASFSPLQEKKVNLESVRTIGA